MPCVPRSSPLSAPDARRKRRRIAKPVADDADAADARAHHEAEAIAKNIEPLSIPTNMQDPYAQAQFAPPQALLGPKFIVHQDGLVSHAHSVACSLLDLANGSSSTASSTKSSSAGSSPMPSSPPPLHQMPMSQLPLGTRMHSFPNMQGMAPAGLLHPVPLIGPGLVQGMAAAMNSSMAPMTMSMGPASAPGQGMGPGMAPMTISMAQSAGMGPGTAMGQSISSGMPDFLSLDCAIIPHLGQIAAQRPSMPYFQSYSQPPNNMHGYVTQAPYHVARPMPHKLIMGWS